MSDQMKEPKKQVYVVDGEYEGASGQPILATYFPLSNNYSRSWYNIHLALWFTYYMYMHQFELAVGIRTKSENQIN